MSKFGSIVEKISIATGIRLAVYSLREIESLNNGIVKKIESDGVVKAKKQVYFSFDSSGEKYVGAFDERGSEDENFARLFAQMLSVDCTNNFESLQLNDKISMLLKGELSIENSESLKSVLENSNPYTYYSVALFCPSKSKREELEEYVRNVKEKDDYILAINETTLAFYKKESSGYDSAIDFARILYESVKEEILIDLCVAVAGEIKNFEDFASSYKKELTALRYGKMLFPKERVYYYKEFALAEIISKVPKTELVKSFASLVSLKDAGVWEDSELIDTAEAFVRCSLNVSETSRIMNIHRNTLMYRLDKIKRETSLDLRKFEDASVFNLINLIRKTLAENIKGDGK